MSMDVHYARRLSARTKRAISVHLHVAVQQPFRADGEHVAVDQHLDHEHRIDRKR
jgi:hypothetical protein